jgi:hypothetical protein
VVAACASVWQLPHFWMNSSRPLAGSEFAVPQPPTTRAIAIAAVANSKSARVRVGDVGIWGGEAAAFYSCASAQSLAYGSESVG